MRDFLARSIFCQLLILPADQDKLKIEAGAVQSIDNSCITQLPYPPNEIMAVGTSGSNPRRRRSNATSAGRRLVEARMKNHSRGVENTLQGMTESDGLIDGFFRTANEKLFLAFNPKMRRIIRDISQDGDKWPAWENTRWKLSQSARLKWGTKETTIAAALASNAPRSGRRSSDDKREWPLAGLSGVGDWRTSNHSAASRCRTSCIRMPAYFLRISISSKSSCKFVRWISHGRSCPSMAMRRARGGRAVTAAGVKKAEFNLLHSVGSW